MLTVLVCIFRVGLEIINGISSNRSVASCSVDLKDHKLIDLKFLGDRDLILLCSNVGMYPTRPRV